MFEKPSHKALPRRWNVPKRMLQLKARRSRKLLDLLMLLSPTQVACSSALTAQGSSKSRAALGAILLRPILLCLRSTREKWRSETDDLMKEALCKKQRKSWRRETLDSTKEARTTSNRSTKSRKRSREPKQKWMRKCDLTQIHQKP